MRLYQDGIEVGRLAKSGVIGTSGVADAWIGANPTASSYFDGRIDDVRIYGEAIDSTIIQQIIAGNLKIDGDNEAPVGIVDSYSLPENTSLNIDASIGVLSNDSDPDHDVLQAVLESGVSNGTLNLNLDGSFVYTPAVDFSGTDSFVYQASDGILLSASTTVTITVTGDNDVPVANADLYTTPPGVVLSVDAVSGLLANDTDPENDVLQVVLITDVSSGNLILNTDGSFEYTPDGGFVGTDSFTYSADDGSLLSPAATVSIDVVVSNSPPIIQTGEVSFTKQVVDVNALQTHIALGADLDNDADIDVVATDFVNDSVYWYEKQADGSFIKHILDSALDGAYPAYLADVNLDGFTDILAAGYDADTVVWYENNGDGSFTRNDIDNLADGAHSVVTADVDDDGDIDLLTTNQDEGSVNLYMNDGNQNFTLSVIDSAATGAKRAEFADVDSDGDMDLVAASFFIDEIAWYDNDGNENFTKRVIDNTADGAYFVSIDDFDGDGEKDIIAASQLDNTIAWYKNTGAGGFIKNVIDGGANGARTVISADVDGDGDIDAIVASVDDDTIAWYQNDGSGQFFKLPIDVAALGAYGVNAVDMDKDGDFDVVTASRDSNEIAVYTQSKIHGITLTVGGSIVIDATRLLTVDADDGASDLVYTVLVAPVTGNLELSGSSLSVGETFTQEDVDNGLISYIHSGVSSAGDFADFSVMDGGENGVLPATGRLSFIIVDSADSLVELPLDEGTGTDVSDISGTGNDGVLVNGPLFEADSADSSPFSVRFDGVDDYIDLGGVDVNGSGLSVAAWFNADTFSGSSTDPRIISKASGTGANEHIFMLGVLQSGSTQRLRVRIRIGGVTTTLIASGGDISTGTWYHAAATYNGSILKIYLDGTRVGSVPLFGNVDTDPSIPVTIGSQPPGAGGQYFDGLIDDVRILQRAISENEIADIVGSSGP